MTDIFSLSQDKRVPIKTDSPLEQLKTFAITKAIVKGGGNPSDYIYTQEAEGQTSFVNSSTLPTKNRDRDAFERLGVQFRDTVQGDDMFEHVELPAGWTKERTDHSMWSDLRDAQGRKVGSIFYKAAHYDRDAFIDMTQRFSVKIFGRYGDDPFTIEPGHLVAAVMDCDTVLWKTDPSPFDPDCRDYEAPEHASKVQEALRDLARGWAEANVPLFTADKADQWLG